MPVYEYRCTKCGEHFEFIQSIKDDPIEKIEDCEEKECHLEKIISLSSFHLKGGGWYKDGYSKKENKGAGDEGNTG